MHVLCPYVGGDVMDFCDVIDILHQFTHINVVFGIFSGEGGR